MVLSYKMFSNLEVVDLVVVKFLLYAVSIIGILGVVGGLSLIIQGAYLIGTLSHISSAICCGIGYIGLKNG